MSTAALLLALLALPASGAGLLLRVETAMHTSPEVRLAADPSGRFLATAGKDKTARLWDARDGSLLRVFRPPIDEGRDGELSAVAVSPDGRTVACAGWAGLPWAQDKKAPFCIYIFDRQDRGMRRICGLPDAVLDLAYSKDGRHLAAALAGRKGVKVYSADGAAGFKLEAEDGDFEGPSYSADWSPSGWLAVSSHDGSVRLYDPSFKRVEKKEPSRGMKPHQIAFSPDGKLLAVGYIEAARVDVLDAGGLSTRWGWSSKESAKDLNLMSVAWSSDGVLHAGGNQPEADRIRRWTADGKPLSPAPAGDNVVLRMARVGDDGIAYVTADPSIGLVSRDGTGRVLVRPAIADTRNVLDKLKVSSDGDTVEFALGPGPDASVRFSVSELSLEKPRPGEELTPALRSGLDVRGWEDTNSPQLGNRKLKLLSSAEYSRSLAIAPDRSGFVLGTDWRLRRYDASGAEAWASTAPAGVRAVDITGDGRLVAAQLGDGTLRWFGMEDGKLVLSLFLHRDGKRWIAWTPSGHYAASVDGDKLAGWHMHQGPEAEADFFSLAQFRNDYCRPARIADIFRKPKAGPRAEEPRIEARVKPPLLRILSPEHNSISPGPELTVRYELRDPQNKPLRGVEVQAKMDHEPVDAWKKVDSADPVVVLERRLRLPARNTVIALRARRPLGKDDYLMSEEPYVSVSRGGSRDLPEPPELPDARCKAPIRPEGRLLALVVGVNRYDFESPRNDLLYAANDAREFAALIREQVGKLYTKADIVLLDGKGGAKTQPTRANILNGLGRLRKDARKGDVTILFLAGHGIPTADDQQEFLFMPKDGDWGNWTRARSSAIRAKEIQSSLADTQGKRLVFLDSCHSGAALKHLAELINALRDEADAMVFAAAATAQKAHERPEWRHGALTYALLKGVRCGGAAPCGRITLFRLADFISENVKDLARGIGEIQEPTITGRNFDFAVCRGKK